MVVYEKNVSLLYRLCIQRYKNDFLDHKQNTTFRLLFLYIFFSVF